MTATGASSGAGSRTIAAGGEGGDTGGAILRGDRGPGLMIRRGGTIRRIALGGRWP